MPTISVPWEAEESEKQPTECEKILVNRIPEEGPVSRTHQESYNSTVKIQITQF